MNGILVIDKPAGITSHDVVARVKKLIRASKVGHLGTLDPNATGVLPLVINRATKSARFLEGGTKSYLSTMKLGEETDTYDIEGKVTRSAGVGDVTEADVREALSAFVGHIEQVPPMFSAVKRKGVPLYKLARKGVVVEREAKEVEIESIEVVSIDLPSVVFSVNCSRGTYVRTLCHDVGARLGCGALLSELRRTSSGAFTLDDAVTMEAGPEELKAAVIPLERAFARVFKAVEISRDDAERIARGAVMLGIDNFPSLKAPEMVRFIFNNRLVALSSYSGDGIFKIEKITGGRSLGEDGKLCANR